MNVPSGRRKTDAGGNTAVGERPAPRQRRGVPPVAGR